MNLLQIVNTAVVVIGVPTILGVFISVGRKLQILDILDTSLSKEIKPDLKDVRERLSTLEGRFSGAFGAASPISLKPIGKKALEESGFSKWIDDNKNELLAKCRSTNSMSNPYDIQEAAFKFFDQLDFGDFESKLKETAYQYGWSIETMRRIGGIYFRDVCLQAHNFKPEDLDESTS